MRWKPGTVSSTESPIRDRDVEREDRISADLQARGVSSAAADVLAGQMVEKLSHGDETYDSTLDGVAIGLRAQDTISEELTRSAGELQEIERLMSCFAGELSKLDEVLEVLAAYLRRMRTTAPATGSRILH
jgi:hypothetical protein